MDPETFWVGVGMLGQAFFSMRFVSQWISSEQKGRSVIPVAFWFLSIGGGILLFCYSVYRRDPVFAIGQGAGLLIYFRNLYFVFRESRDPQEEPT